jgi:transcriptional regulator with GAF, ATPase, and Fis domain
MAWFVIVGKMSPRVRDAVTTLRRRGFVEGGASASPQPGIIILARPSADLDEVLRCATSSGQRVLVAIATDPCGCEPWSMLSAGAEDVVELRTEGDVDHAIARVERWSEVDELLDSERVRDVVRGDAPCWRSAVRQVVEIARFTSSSVLISGETGTGKEVVARLIHDLDARTDIGELVLVDCTTVVPTLSGSEFFGHEKGAFTGALVARSGAFSRANGGTLFLDEVGELPLTLQAELLRVVQEGYYKPVGGNDWRSTTFRLIAATNRDLLEAQAEGKFRSDFYFRLAGAMVHLPPLRERVEDVVPLFRYFFAQARGDHHEPLLDAAVATFLRKRPYPGNVRDLQQLAVRVASRHVGCGPITPGDIPPIDRPDHTESPSAFAPAPTTSSDSNGEVENLPPVSIDVMAELEGAIRRAMKLGVGLKRLKVAVPEIATRVALEQTGGPTAAARLLGVSRRAVDYRKANGETTARRRSP